MMNNDEHRLPPIILRTNGCPLHVVKRHEAFAVSSSGLIKTAKTAPSSFRRRDEGSELYLVSKASAPLAGSVFTRVAEGPHASAGPEVLMANRSPDAERWTSDNTVEQVECGTPEAGSSPDEETSAFLAMMSWRLNPASIAERTGASNRRVDEAYEALLAFEMLVENPISENDPALERVHEDLVQSRFGAKEKMKKDRK